MRSLRITGALAVAMATASLGACDSLLEVQNPGAVQNDQLSDTLNASLLVGTVIGDFQRVYDDLARNSSWLSDEMVSGHNFVGYREWDGRIVREDQGELGDVYDPLHQARFSADSLAGRLQQLYPQPNGAQSLALARMRAYGGYTYVLLGEMFCESPIDPESAPLPSDEILKLAIPRFEAAITAAAAAKAGGAKAASADSLANLARVGAARAYLDLGDKAKAIEFARQVPADFEFRSFYTEDPSKDYLENIYYGSSVGGNQNLGVDVYFRNLNDFRVKHTATSRTGHNGATPLWRPYLPPSFSGFTPTADTLNFQKNTSIRFSSGLEARYIIAEAGGYSDAELLSFLNERRAVGGQPALTSLPADELAEIRDQRRRDFFLDGHRLGDLRRYKELYGVDQFPTGQHPDPFLGTYGTAECFVPIQDERQGNPGY